jgi:molybdopterin-containing oxidoreductase family iron-sulfur binding subunit
MTTEPTYNSDELTSDDVVGNDAPVIETTERGGATFESTDRGQVVYAPGFGPLESPAKDIQKGHLYRSAEEVVAEVGEAFTEPLNKGEAPSSWQVKRRDFFKLFSAASAASAASCVRRPLEKAIPYVNQPVDQAVGVSTFYASTCGECSSGCGIVVRTSSGLPVKIEGNAEHPLSQGSTCAAGQASLQGLFHPDRLTQPLALRGKNRDTASWEDAFELLANRIDGKKVAIFTGGSTGNQRQFYTDFLKKLGGAEDDLYTWESNSLIESIVAAHRLVYGTECMPRPDMRFAKVVVGLGSDFLDVGTSSVFFSKNYSQLRTLKDGQIGKHIQFETMMTRTGAKADERFVSAPGADIVVALLLLRSLVEKGANKGSAASKASAQKLVGSLTNLDQAYTLAGADKATFDRIADELLNEPSLVLAGHTAFDQNATMLQVAAIHINELIGAYGKTLLIDRGWMRSPVRIGDLPRFIKNVNNYDAVLFIETNPVFALPASYGFADILKKIPLVVSMQSNPNQMDAFASFVLPVTHPLESWGDEQPVAGFWSARQPVVQPIKGSWQTEDGLLWVLAHLKKSLPYADYRSYIREKWRTVASLNDSKVDFDNFFDSVLRRGFVGKLETRAAPAFKDVSGQFQVDESAFATGLRLMAPLDARLHDGRGANKPILQEIGDTLTTIAWDTWVGMNPNTAKKLNLRRNDVLSVQTSTGTLKVALYPMPGLHPDAVVINRGNGHGDDAGLVERNVGVNPLALLPVLQDAWTGSVVTSGIPVQVSSTGELYRLAAMQKAHDIGNRTDIIKKYSAAEITQITKKRSLDDVPDLYPRLKADDESPYRWGMSIDLTKCTGCGSCMAACAIENNIPQVGREQILLGREMHWIRLDVYYAGSIDSPQVAIQPMLCQQCTHAPCEAVCPVFATTHDPEGINAMTYNRCIGTRYCANACPYKVRRFNWWTHKWGIMGERPQDRMPRALNPDVTVRTRGVMEKCNFCIQRVRDGKFKAKERGGLVKDGEVMTACAQACPSDAITFGNLKDEGSEVAKLRRDTRAYLALGGNPEINEFGIKTLPNVSYLAMVMHGTPLGTGAEEHHGSNAGHGEPAGANHVAPHSGSDAKEAEKAPHH